ncbi:MAG: hypothetical protein EBQ92_00490, partial [Proteobacteria bacterium]|nr:hypothetical protein [Pseudomonadota bacterium]
ETLQMTLWNIIEYVESSGSSKLAGRKEVKEKTNAQAVPSYPADFIKKSPQDFKERETTYTKKFAPSKFNTLANQLNTLSANLRKEYQTNGPSDGFENFVFKNSFPSYDNDKGFGSFDNAVVAIQTIIEANPRVVKTSIGDTYDLQNSEDLKYYSNLIVLFGSRRTRIGAFENPERVLECLEFYVSHATQFFHLEVKEKPKTYGSHLNSRLMLSIDSNTSVASDSRHIQDILNVCGEEIAQKYQQILKRKIIDLIFTDQKIKMSKFDADELYSYRTKQTIYAFCSNSECAYHDDGFSYNSAKDVSRNSSPQCPNQHKFCIICLGEFHDPSTPCPEFNIDEKLSEIKDQKRCPTCKIWISRNAGCNSMTCKCGQKFCWNCGIPFAGKEGWVDHGNCVHMPPEDERPARRPRENLQARPAQPARRVQRSDDEDERPVLPPRENLQARPAPAQPARRVQRSDDDDDDELPVPRLRENVRARRELMDDDDDDDY